MYKTDPAMHPNNAAMMVFTSVVVVVVALLPFRAAAAAEGMLRSFRYCAPGVVEREDKNELEKKSRHRKKRFRVLEYVFVRSDRPSSSRRRRGGGRTNAETRRRRRRRRRTKKKNTSHEDDEQGGFSSRRCRCRRRGVSRHVAKSRAVCYRGARDEARVRGTKATPSGTTATAAIGRNVIASLLLGAFKGDEETVQITFKGDGPLGQLTAVSDNLGNTKCLVGNAKADPPLRPDGKLNVGMAIGKGVLSVSRSHPSWVQPYNGQVDIYTGRLRKTWRCI